MIHARSFVLGVVVGFVGVLAFLIWRLATFKPETPLQEARREAYLENEDS